MVWNEDRFDNAKTVEWSHLADMLGKNLEVRTLD